ncbi:hypothetical protein ACQ4WX_20090 [Streptomyces lasalocidi]
MAGFLNTFLSRNRNLEHINKEELGKAFSTACRLLVESNTNALRYQKTINAAHVDAILASMMELCLEGSAPDPLHIKRAIQELRADKAFAGYVTRSTSHSDSVRERLRIAYSALGGSDSD